MIPPSRELTKGFVNVKSTIYLVNGITKIELSACNSLAFELLKCARTVISINAYMDSW